MKKANKLTTKRSKTYFSKNVRWLEPFFYSAEGLIPIEKITSVRGYSIPLDKSIQSYANIYKVGGKFRITLNIKENDVLKDEQLLKYVGLILEDFAHELSHAHPDGWSHDYKHFALTAKVMLKFAKVLKKKNLETDVPVHKIGVTVE
jgi:hypothetical protein